MTAIPLLAVWLRAFWLLAAPPQEGAWGVPEEARAVANPLAANEEMIAEGKMHFRARCESCHGEAGKGDGKATRFIRPAPADISTTEARDRMTDGEIFFKITEGKKPMPGMARTLTEDERWQVVLYLRTLQTPR